VFFLPGLVSSKVPGVALVLYGRVESLEVGESGKGYEGRFGTLFPKRVANRTAERGVRNGVH
jgi:hypothetical protein